MTNLNSNHRSVEKQLSITPWIAQHISWVHHGCFSSHYQYMEEQKRTDVKDGSEIRNRLLKDSRLLKNIWTQNKSLLEIKQIKQTG